MSSETPSKNTNPIPRTPSTHLPSAAFTTPRQSKEQVNERIKQMSDEYYSSLNPVQEHDTETESETQHKQATETHTEQQPENSTEFTTYEMKRQFDLQMIQMQHQLAQTQHMLQQTQEQNAFLQYQQRIQYHAPHGSSDSASSNFIKNVGKPEYYTGDMKSNPDTWLDMMLEYMMLIGTEPQKYVPFTITYLREQARVWWSSMSMEDKIANQDFEQFKQTFLAKYRPVDQARTARAKLKTLKQTTSVAAYNNEFSNVIQLIHDMSLADKLDKYFDGLKQPVLERLPVLETFTSVADAMNAANSIDTRIYKPSGHGFNRGNFQRGGYNGGYGQQRSSNKPSVQVNNVQAQDSNEYEQDEDKSTSGYSVNAVRFTKLTDEQRLVLRREGRCFKCRNVGHLSRDCPTRNDRGSMSNMSMKPSAPISNTKKY